MTAGERTPERPAARWTRVAVAAFVVGVSCVACGIHRGAGSTAEPATAVEAERRPPPSPSDRSAAVVTTGCGASASTMGSAVRLDATTYVTAAHVVAGAKAVGVLQAWELPPGREWPDFSPVALFETSASASVVAYDTERDLALIAVDDDTAVDRSDLPPIGTAPERAAIELHTATGAGPVPGVVIEHTRIVADEVRGQARVERDGYQLAATTRRGDSGAGVWDAQGRLVGVVFAVSSDDGTRTWAVSGQELTAFLDEFESSPDSTYRCEESRSQLIVDISEPS